VTLDDLIAIEAIKQLKARYFRYLDTKQWESWGQVFTEDAILENPLSRDEPLRGRAEIVDTVSSKLGAEVITVHHGHMPEIELVGEGRAHGVWAMYDRLTFPSSGGNGHAPMEGYGHYIEQYVRDTDGEWRIAHLQLRRLHLATGKHERNADPAVFPS
jgi:hypothetical protein